MNFIIAIIIFILSFVTLVLRVLFLILILTLIIIIFKLIIRNKKFRKSEFRIFQKNEKTKYIDIIKCMIKKNKIFTIIIENKKIYTDLIVLSETGIYLLKIEKLKGNVTGSKNDLKLKVRISEKIEKETDNPFYYLEKDKEKILLIDNKLIVKTILITNNGVNLLIDNINKNQIYNIANFYYMIENDLKKTKIYDRKYLEKLSILFSNLNN